VNGSGLKIGATEPVELSYSALSDFQRCPLYYFYNRVLKVVPVGEHMMAPVFGQAFHAADEAHSKGMPIPQAVDVALAIYTPVYKTAEAIRTPELLRTLLEEYFKYYAFDLQRYEWIGSEVPFEIMLTPDLQYRGIIDKVMRDKQSGKIWLKDIKTTSSPASFLSEPNDQFAAYLWAAQQMYPKDELAGMLVDVVGVKKNSLVFRKDGKGWYAGCGPSDTYFRYPTYRSEQQLDEWHVSTRMMCYVIQSCYQLETWPMFTSNCRKFNRECSYRGVCIQPAEARGEMLSSSMFKPKPERVKV
jgi:RecB family exonuclease